MQGSVKSFNKSKRFGNITLSDVSKDVNVRSDKIQRDGGYKALSLRQKVEFESGKDQQEPQAENVRGVE